MHRLLKRQLKKYTGSEDVSAEWVGLFEAISTAYQQNEDDRLLSEHSLRLVSDELLTMNKDLSVTLEQLKNAQAQMVHTEKMAGLGQLVAGVSHEVNTPAGAIANAILEIKNDYTSLLGDFIKIGLNLDEDKQHNYINACEFILSNVKEISTVDARQNARLLEKELESNNISNARSKSQQLAMLGFTLENIEALFPLLKSEYQDTSIESLFKLGRSQTHVRNIEIAISRIVNLVKALKVYSRSGDEGVCISNLREDIDNTLIILNSRLKRGILVEKNYGDIPSIECYADQLNQVWTNIINNSIEAMKGEGKISITLKAASNSHVCVEIEDNGPGIPTEILPRIFEPYFTTKIKGEGTGLGLSIVKQILDKHCSTIDVISSQSGTKFIITLPMTLERIKSAND